MGGTIGVRTYIPRTPQTLSKVQNQYGWVDGLAVGQVGGRVDGWVVFFQVIFPLSGSILQTGTCHIAKLSSSRQLKFQLNWYSIISACYNLNGIVLISNATGLKLCTHVYPVRIWLCKWANLNGPKISLDQKIFLGQNFSDPYDPEIFWDQTFL